jgi:hypothetical protein
MRRRSENIIAGISAALFVAMILLWVRSWWIADEVAILGRYREISIVSVRGVCLFRGSNTGHAARHLRWLHDSVQNGGWTLNGVRAFPGFTHWNETWISGQVHAMRWMPDVQPPQKTEAYNFVFPQWLPAILFLVLPIFAIKRERQRRARMMQGHCRVCGYDLRATPERCPECGTEAKSEVKCVEI